ncbi:hypothetical protein STRIP9103_04389 [Streptomyces ipomoeae 91-03]|uniref:Uncharacterized protein n=1 Tax=Streptomyces ipomoeae 91-03 TaxID=698759 RepID=L1KW65_9ACTN|nr:hypothetical protein STRIP9103_04389 [Streptomyces ipomoeae 91-03]
MLLLEVRGLLLGLALGVPGVLLFTLEGVLVLAAAAEALGHDSELVAPP